MKAGGNGSQSEKTEWIFISAMAELEDSDDGAENVSRSQQDMWSSENKNTESIRPEILYSCTKKKKFKE